MPLAIPDNACLARVHELLETMGMTVHNITPEAAQWIELCCAFSMPPELTSTLYLKLTQWATLAETVNLEILPSAAIAAAKADFFIGKIALPEVRDLIKQMANGQGGTAKP